MVVTTQGVDKAVNDLKQLENQSKKTAQSSGGLEDSVTSLDDVLSSFNVSTAMASAGIYGLYKAFNSMISAFKNFTNQALSAYSASELLSVQLSTVVKNLGATAEEANALSESLRKFAVETTFSFDQLAEASKILLTTGVAQEDLMDKMKRLGNMAGGEAGKFQELVDVYSKIRSEGKAGAVRLSQLSRITGTSMTQALGKASASLEEVDNLIVKLTDDGGMFAGAMDNINDTLTGKLDFVSDTWQELLSNFAQASGIADVAKAILDKVYNALQNLVDGLVEINKDPFMKAVLQGAVASAITGVATVIGVTLVLALKAFIAKATEALAIQTALNTALGILNPALLIGGVVALGAGAGVLAYAKANQEAVEKIDETASHLNELNDTLRENKDLLNQGIGGQQSYLQTQLEALNTQIKQSEESLKEMEDKFSSEASREFLNSAEGKAFLPKRGQVFDDNFYKGWAKQNQPELFETGSISDFKSAYQKALKEASKLWIVNTKSSKELSKQVEYVESLKSKQEDLNGILESQKEYTENLDKVSSIIGELDNSAENELKKYQTQLESLLAMYDKTVKVETLNADGTISVEEKKYIDLDPEFAKKLEEAIKLTKEKIETEEINVKLNVISDIKTDYQSFLQDKLGLSDEELTKYYSNGKLNIGTQTLVDNIKGSARGDFGSGYVYELNKSKANNNIGAYTGTVLTEDTAIQTQLKDAQTALQMLIDYADLAKDDTTENGVSYEKGNLLLNDNALQNLTDFIQKLQLSYVSSLLNYKDSYNEQKSMSNTLGIDFDEQSFFSNLISQLEPMFIQLYQEGYNFDSFQGQELLKLLKEIREKSNDNNDSTSNTEDTSLSETISDTISSGLIGLLSGSDVGTFVSTLAMSGDPLIALLKVVIEDVIKLISNLDNLDYILNPVQIILQSLTPALQAIVNAILPIFTVVISLLSPIVEILGDTLVPILKVLEILLKVILLPLQGLAIMLAKLASLWSDVTDEWMASLNSASEGLDSLYESTLSLESTTEDLTSEYTSLLQAMKDQEEYYIEQKRNLSAQSYINSIPVNDMILTPQGNFSTSPDDYIIASKNPSSLGSSNATVSMNVQINNTMSDNANVSVSQRTDSNGMQSLLIDISKKVANDMATGANGWDSAYSTQQTRLQGRRVSV